MRRIGLIGGTTYHSTLEYYRLLNQGVQERSGGQHFAELVLESLDFGQIIRNNLVDDQVANAELVGLAARRLANAEVEAILPCANTLHMFTARIQAESGLPVLHIATPVACAIRDRGLERVALLGTKFTMNLDIYDSVLKAQGIDLVTPNAGDAERVHETIYGELAQGDFGPVMRHFYLEVIERLVAKGAQGVILGCTEIPLLLRPEEIPIPSFNTIALHVHAAVDFMLG